MSLLGEPDSQSTAHHGQGGGVGCQRLGPLEAEPGMGVPVRVMLEVFQGKGRGKQAEEGKGLETGLRLVPRQRKGGQALQCPWQLRPGLTFKGRGPSTSPCPG